MVKKNRITFFNAKALRRLGNLIKKDFYIYFFGLLSTFNDLYLECCTLSLGLVMTYFTNQKTLSIQIYFLIYCEDFYHFYFAGTLFYQLKGPLAL